MIKIKIFKTKGNITGFEMSGHAGYAKSGHDIVCAAVSSISQSACFGILKVVNVPAVVKKDDKKGYLYLKLPKNIEEQKNHDAQVLLKTMELSINDLLFDYKDYINMEVCDEVY